MKPDRELKHILSFYQLGELVDYERDTRGTVNTSYTITTASAEKRSRYFLRRYKTGIKEEEIQFEHSLVNHLFAKQSPPIAHVYETTSGATYVKLHERGKLELPVFYAIFDFLEGDDRYTWINPKCRSAEIQSSAVVLAQFHQSVSDLIPAGRRVEPPILEFLPQLSRKCEHFRMNSKGTTFDQGLSENFNLIQDAIAETLATLLHGRYQNMLKLVIHCDYHPGNLKFLDEEVVGVFDFDWAKIDYRVFDIALACYYFFTDWEASRDGHVRLEPLALFIRTYQEYIKTEQIIPSMSDDELRCFPAMLQASNLYVLNWTLADFYAKQVDPQEYTIYLNRAVETIHWLNNLSNRSHLIKAVNSCNL